MDAEAVRLRPRSSNVVPVRAETARQALIDADPAVGLARWLLVDLEVQFEQFRRANRWRAMLAPLSSIETVRPHHPVALGDGRAAIFDIATFTGGTLHHVVDRVAHGTKEAVEDFVARVTAAKRASGPPRGLAGAVLVAPRFSEDALAAYLGALRAARGRFRSALDAWSHREGILATEAGGCHVLLVEEQGGRRRPLVMEE